MSDIDAMKFFRALDKRDRVGIGGVFELLTDGRKDQSGDFTEGVGLSPAKAGCVIEFMTCADSSKNNFETMEKMQRWAAIMALPKKESDALYSALKTLGLITEDDERMASDPVALREYYGTKYEKPTWR